MLKRIRSYQRAGSAGFSLMEILVVLVVISILVGLLFPALMRARERARINRAMSEVRELQKAWHGYYMTYGEFPSGGTAMMDTSLTQLLAGVDVGGDNPNQIAFMDFSEKALADGFKDPWGRLYEVQFDTTSDTTETVSFESRVQCVNAKRYKY
jgi:prepilin-type N-terminal cleavage/methylation domain-containing protein